MIHVVPACLQLPSSTSPPKKTTLPLQFSKEYFNELGLMLGGNWSDSTISNMSCKARTAYFVDFFYVSPRTATDVYRDIQHPDLGENQIKKPDPRAFLGGLYFLKKYPSKKAQAGFIGCSEKYGLPKAWKYVEAIQALKEKKIRWIFDEEPHRNFQEYYFLTVDKYIFVFMSQDTCQVQDGIPRSSTSLRWHMRLLCQCIIPTSAVLTVLFLQVKMTCAYSRNLMASCQKYLTIKEELEMKAMLVNQPSCQHETNLIQVKSSS